MLRRVILRRPVRLVTLKPPTDEKFVKVEAGNTTPKLGPYQMVEISTGRIRDWSGDKEMRNRIHLGRDIFASVEEWQEKVTISFRAWSEREGDAWGPTKRGVNISLEEWRVLEKNFDTISAKMVSFDLITKVVTVNWGTLNKGVFSYLTPINQNSKIREFGKVSVHLERTQM